MRAERSARFSEIFPILVLCHERANWDQPGTLLAPQAEAWPAIFRRAAASDPGGTIEAIRVAVHRGLAERLRGLLTRWEVLEILDEPIVVMLDEIVGLYERVDALQRQSAEIFAAALANQGITAVTLKSHDIIDRYGSSLCRDLRYDVDYLIAWEDYDAVRKILVDDIGFVQGAFTNGKIVRLDDPRNIENASSHYEWWPFLRTGPTAEFDQSVAPFIEATWPFAPGDLLCNSVSTFVAFDLHYGVDPEIDSSVVWSRVQELSAGQHALSSAALVWFLAGRLYHETIIHGAQRFRTLGQVIDVVRGGDVDWDDVARLCLEYKTQPAVYYVLKLVEDLCGLRPPKGWLLDLKETFLGNGHLHDFGSLWAPLLRLDRDESILVDCSDL